MAEQPNGSFWERLQDDPRLMLAGAASFFAVAVAILLLVVVFSGGDDGEDEEIVDEPSPTTAVSASPTPTTTASGPVPAVADVAPHLDFFGDLVAVNSHPVTATFDSDSGSLELEDGSTLEVPRGAFTTQTDVTVAIIDLRWEDYLEPALDGRIYVVSTEADIALDTPVVLEVPKAGDSVVVAEFAGGEWSDVSVAPGTTTLIEIDHFSERTFASSDEIVDQMTLRAQDVANISLAKSALSLCFDAMKVLLGDSGNFVVNVILFKVCAQALEDTAADPDGVDLECVSGAMDEGAEFEDAADDCDDDATPAPTPTSSPTATVTAMPTQAPTPGATDSLSLNVAQSFAEEEQCVERPDHGNVQCSYTFSIVLDYTAAELPRNVACHFENQSAGGALVFYPLESGFEIDLTSQQGSVTVEPRGVAVFSPSADPLFTNPATLNCRMAEPIGGGVNQFQAGADVPFDLAGFTQIDSCLPATHPDCTVQ